MADKGLRNAVYGLRPDGTPKGNGWLGPIPMTNGEVMTEQTIDIDLDGKRTYMPLLVPGHSAEEMELLRGGGKPTKPMVDRAVEHGLRRMRQGLSPYVD